MKNMTISNLAGACHGRLCGCAEGREAASVVIDSRKTEKDSIFIATRGERVDGHDFILQAEEKGALAVVCEREPAGCSIPYILVKDSFRALREIAEFYRQQLSLPVIGITGSVGKTSTKEMIAAVLSQKYKVQKTMGNFNNEIGLPLTVLSIRREHQAAVLEMGISDFGEMHRLSKIARPDYCVLTNIGQCHLENLGSREGILKAKTEIFDFMDPQGRVFVNGDDDMLRRISEVAGRAPVRFGPGLDNDVFASDIMGKGLFGVNAVIHAYPHVFPVEIPLPGEHMVRNALAAAAVGFELGLTPGDIRQGIAHVEAVEGRSHLMQLPGCTVIDDCYNANPASMRAAIDLLSMAAGRKVAILGDMFELGDCEKQLHGEIGAYAAQRGIDVVICVGELARCMYDQARACEGEKSHSQRLYYFAGRDEMLQALPQILRGQDTILVKASHGMHFEKVVETIAKSPALGYTDKD